MSISQREERRALSADEWAAVEPTHHPAIQGLDDGALRDLVKRVRDLRDRARTEAHRRRREMRGKARPKGAEASRRDDGSKVKMEVLAQAMKRLNGELDRRRRSSGREATAEAARRALALKRASSAGRGRPVKPGRTARHGMQTNPNERTEELARPMERGRVSQFVKNSQAARDSR